MSCEMYLEIAEVSAAERGLRFQLRWQVKELADAVEVTLVSPLSTHTTELLARYVRDFRSWDPSERDRAVTAERTVLTLGRALGSAMVDPDYRLLELCEAIEKVGIAALHVCIRADSVAARAIPWETLILPDAAYCVAAAGASFVRAPSALRPLAATDSGAATLPLRYLRVGNAANITRASHVWRQVAWQGALSFRIVPVLPTGSDQWQIVHWSGQLAYHDGELAVQQPGEEAWISAHAFCKQLRVLGTQLLILEPELGGPEADELAYLALHSGIDNVVTQSQPIELGWPSDWTEHLLECIGLGLGLRQAVVETRMRLQGGMLAARQAEPTPPHAAQVWHALRHYSARDVRFFDGPVERVSWESSPGFAQLRSKLFGFDSNAWPPAACDLGDQAALRLVELLHRHGAVAVTAAAGGGLSYALQRAALLACGNGDVERAYFWDFAREAFEPREILEMVAGVHGQADPAQVTEQSVLARLSASRELFVFDNLDSLHDRARVEALVALAERVASHGGFCLLGSHAALDHDGLAMWRLPALSEAEQVGLVSTHAPKLSLCEPRARKLIHQLQGHPLLLTRVLHDVRAEQLDALNLEATQHFGRDVDRSELVQRFYAWRWSQLEPHWRTLLRAWQPLGGLYLQTLMVAIDLPGGGQSDTGRDLWEQLAAPAGSSCATAIARMQAAGFVVPSRHGSRIDPSALRFIEAQRLPELPQRLESVLARALFTGVLRVLGRGARPGVDLLAGHILEHRQALRQQLALVFESSDYTFGMRVFLGLSRLLQQAGASREAGEWASTLLDAFGPALCTHREPALGAGWLSIALQALTAPPSAEITRGARYWHELLVLGELQANVGLRALVPLAVVLLEQVYDRAADHTSYRTVARAACDYYGSQQNVPALIEQLIGLAAAEHVLGNDAERDRVEEELLQTCGELKAPESDGLRERTLLRLARMRLRRGDEAGANAVVTLLERARDGASPSASAWLVRAELCMRREQWESAAELYCMLWAAAMSGTKLHGMDIDATASALGQLEQRLGAARFAALYESCAGTTPTPEALGVGKQVRGAAMGDDMSQLY